MNNQQTTLKIMKKMFNKKKLLTKCNESVSKPQIQFSKLILNLNIDLSLEPRTNSIPKFPGQIFFFVF